ncbi:MAG: ABC transporter permease [Tissierellia bacterium]|nr:ABC transporter permease [Tissierellia bacterium]
MGFYARIIYKYQKNNIFRTLLTIVGLIISISMIVFILTWISSLNYTNYKKNVRLYGYEDFEIDQVDPDLYRRVLLTPNVSRLSKVDKSKKHLSYYEDLNGHEALADFLIKDVEGDYFTYFFKKNLVEGRLPIRDKEALLPYSLKQTFEDFSELGKELILPTLEAKNYTFSNPRRSDISLEKFHEIRKIGLGNFVKDAYGKNKNSLDDQTIKIVGFYSSSRNSVGSVGKRHFIKSRERDFDYYFGEIIRYNEISANTFSVEGLYRDYDKAFRTENDLKNLVESGGKPSRFISNDRILQFKRSQLFDSSQSLLLTAIMILIIMISIYTFIYNIFTTNFRDKLKDVSLFRVLGFTDIQVFKGFFLESLLYWIISFPLGYLIGKTMLKLSVSYIQAVFDNNILGLFTDISYRDSFWIFIISLIISLIIVFTPQFFAVKNLYKESPINSLKDVFDYGDIRQARAYQKIIKRLLGPKAYLTIRYAVRDKRRLIITTVSISISMMIFVIASYVVKAFDIQAVKVIERNRNSYAILETDDRANTSKFIADIDSIRVIRATHNTSYAKIRLADADKELEGQTSVMILIDDDIFQEHFSSYGADYKFALTLKPISYEGREINRVSILPQYLGDRGDRDLKPGSDEVLKNFTFKIRELEKSNLEIITYFKNFENYDNVLIAKTSNLSEKDESDFGFNDLIELLKEDDKAFSENDLIAYLSKYPNFDIDGYNPPQIQVIKVYSGLLIGLVILIAILNIFNTNYDDIVTRKREMALLKAVGADDNTIERIIMNQSILSVILASFFSMFLSASSILALYRLQKYYLGGKMVPLIYPILLYVVAVLVALIIVVFASFVQIKSIKSYNLLEELKKV